MSYDKLRKKMFEDRQTYIDEQGDYWAVCNMENYTGAVKGIAIDKLAELEDDLESGKLIRLPCKVGDNFYEIDTLYCEYRKHEVSGFTVENGELILIDGYFNGYKASEVCLTKAEAEKKLKELEK